MHVDLLSSSLAGIFFRGLGSFLVLPLVILVCPQIVFGCRTNDVLRRRHRQSTIWNRAGMSLHSVVADTGR